MEYQFPEIDSDSLTIQQQVWKVQEEMKEVEAEYDKIIVDQLQGYPAVYTDLILETLDLMHSCETLLRLLPVSKIQIDRAHRQVIGKNRKRNYYKEG